MTKPQVQAVLDRATDKQLRDSAVMLENTMLATEDLDRRLTYGDALEFMIEEIERRIGNVDHVRIDMLFKNGRRTYTKALFDVHPRFGAE